MLRKFGAEPPQEWVAALSALQHGQVERGLRRLVFGWKGGPPSLPDFMRLCRTVGMDEFDEGPLDLPALAGPDTWSGDNWGAAANRYLLGHIMKRLQKNPKFYGRGATYELMRAPLKDLEELGVDKHYLDASGEFVTNVRKLVAAKNNWAADMRDLARNGEVPPETQKAVWYDYLNSAEKGLA